jgi:hypothetical protein
MKAALFCAVAAVAALMAPMGTVLAEDMQFTSQAQLNSLLYSHEAGTPTQLIRINGGDCCTDADPALESCCRDPWWTGIEGGLELTLLNVYANHGAGERNGGNSWFDVDPDTRASLRYWVGWRGEGGLGVRARYFSYYSQMGDAGVDLPDFFDARLFDLEATALLSFCKWDIDVFGGFRYGDLRWSDENGAPGYNFSGAGPTLGANVRRELIGNLGLVGGIRTSFLMGQTTELTLLDESLHTTCNMTEARLGVDWRREMGRGTLVIGAAWEQQLYTGLSGNVDNDIDPEDIDITLAGPVFWVSFQR